MPRFMGLLRNGPRSPPPYPPLPRFLFPLPPRLLSRRMLLLCLINWSSDISRFAVFVSVVAVMASLLPLPALELRIQQREKIAVRPGANYEEKSNRKVNDDVRS